MILLETPRFRLRRFTPDDVDRLVELDSDPEVMRYITGGRPTPRELYVTTFMPRWWEIYAKQPLLGYWAAERLPDGEFLGWFHLRRDGWNADWLELGYRLRRAVWGRGLATEGTLALMAVARSSDPDVVFSARTVPENTASRRVMEKCGLELQLERFTFPAREWPGWVLPACDGVLYLSPANRSRNAR